MNKWDKLKSMIEADLSHSDRFIEIKNWMVKLDIEEKGFYFTDIPDFDRKAWERILDERGIQGLS